MNKEELNRLSNKVIGIAINIHKKIGPGFPEKIYQRILAKELEKINLGTKIEKKIEIIWDKQIIGYQYIDLLVENELIIEIKINPEITDLYKAQLLSYLKASNKKLGLIISFGDKIIQIKRIVNKL